MIKADRDSQDWELDEVFLSSSGVVDTDVS